MKHRRSRGFSQMVPLLATVGILSMSSEARADDDTYYDRVSFSVSATRDVPSDTVVATLYVQIEGRDQSQLADEVNRTMRWAMDRAERVPEVKAETLGYSTTPVYQNQRITGWRARQTLELTSRTPEALTSLVGDLQERLAVGGIGYEVSREVREATEDELIEQALTRLSERASRIAAALGRRDYRIVDIQIGSDGYRPPPPVYRSEARMMAQDVAAPVVEAGEQSLGVSISATVELDAAGRQDAP